MPSTTFIKLIAAAALLGACAAPAPEPRVDPIIASAPSPELDFAANGVEAELRDAVGPAGGGALTEVSRDGGTVTAVIEVLVDAASLTAGQREAAASAIRDTFVAGVCEDTGLGGFFALGGVLQVVARGGDGAPLADLPVSSCA